MRTDTGAMCGATSCGACGWNASYEASYTGNKRDGVVYDGADHLINDGGQRTYGARMMPLGRR